MPRMPVRKTHPCDGCTLRRVRCEGSQPCQQCIKYSLECTFLQPRRKRGPKSHRDLTTQKVVRYQKALQQNAATGLEAAVGDLQSGGDCGPSLSDSSQIPLEAFIRVLGIYQEQLYSIWPIVSCGDLIDALQRDESDHESFALASSLCAASVAQLRLLDHLKEHDVPSDERFEQEALQYRSQYDYRQPGRSAGLLTSFFLHIFWANRGDFGKAEWYLREAVSSALAVSYSREHNVESETEKDQEMRIRTYWILFVTERTYCVVHGCPALLDPIDDLPRTNLDDDPNDVPIAGLTALAQSFRCLHKDIMRNEHVATESLTPSDISTMHRRLSGSEDYAFGLNEIQKIDLVVTNHWIRALLWSYTICKFDIYHQPNDEAFSAHLPTTIALNLSHALCSPSEVSLRAHGYGMELKIFRIANSLLNILACNAMFEQPQSLSYGHRDLLSYLENIILIVGGSRSAFLKSLRDRMAEARLRIPCSWQRVIESREETEKHENDRINMIELGVVLPLVRPLKSLRMWEHTSPKYSSANE